MTSAPTKLPFAHEQERGINRGSVWKGSVTPHLKNQSVDCSRIPSASRTLKEKYAGVAEESLRLSIKERVEENETVGTPARGGEGEKEGG